MATLTGLAAILMSLSLESAIARMWHEAKDQEHRKRLLTSVMVFVLTFGSVIFFTVWAASCLLVSAVGSLKNIQAILPVAMSAALLLSISSVPQMVLRMERSIFKFGILQIGNSVLGIAFSLGLILHFGMGLFGLFFGYLMAAALVLALSIHWTRQYLQRQISQQEIKECLKYSLPLVPAVFLSWANSQVDRLILLSLLGLAVLGVYGAAAKVAMIITVLLEVFRLAWLPNALTQINKSSRNSYFRNNLAKYLAVMTCIGLVLVAYSRELLALLTTDEYASGYVVIPWLVGAHIFYGSSVITNVGMLISKKTSGNSIAAFLGTVVNVALCLILVAAFGIMGAAIGSFVAAIIFTLMLLWLSMRQVNIPFNIRQGLELTLIYITTSVGVVWIYKSSTNDSLIWRTFLLAISVGYIIFSTTKSIRSPVPSETLLA